MTKPQVSVVMITYGHEDFILEAIEGVLMQKNNFEVELIIANDNSPDSTHLVVTNFLTNTRIADNIIIKYIRHDVNKGMMLNFLWALEQAKGKYVALCEGDDYWTDPLKLQKQFDLLEKNHQINICISKANSLFPDGSEKVFCSLEDFVHIIDFNDCILGPKIDFFPTCTFMFRSSILPLPQWFLEAPVGDYFLQLIASQNQGCLYLPDITAIYRRDAVGSYSSNYSLLKGLQVENGRVIALLKYKKNNIKQLNKRNSIALNKRITWHQFSILALAYRTKNFYMFLKTFIALCFKPFITLEVYKTPLKKY